MRYRNGEGHRLSVRFSRTKNSDGERPAFSKTGVCPGNRASNPPERAAAPGVHLVYIQYPGAFSACHLHRHDHPPLALQRLAFALLDIDHQIFVAAARAWACKARRGHGVAFTAARCVRIGLFGRATVVCGVENEVVTVVMEAARAHVAAAGGTDAALADEEVWRRWIR